MTEKRVGLNVIIMHSIMHNCKYLLRNLFLATFPAGEFKELSFYTSTLYFIYYYTMFVDRVNNVVKIVNYKRIESETVVKISPIFTNISLCCKK